MAIPGPSILVQSDVGNGCVIQHVKPQPLCKVAQVAHHVAGVGIVSVRVVSEEQPGVVAEQRVPVVAQVELGIGLAGVPRVDADELAVPGVAHEEAARPRGAFKHHVVSASPLQEVGHLQARGPGAQDAVVPMHGRPGLGRAQGERQVQGDGQEQPGGAPQRGGGGEAHHTADHRGEASDYGGPLEAGGREPGTGGLERGKGLPVRSLRFRVQPEPKDL